MSTKPGTSGDNGSVDTPQHAIVFSGGGANAAYEVGVIKALTREPTAAGGGQPIDPEIYTGTSIGALNAALLISKDHRNVTTAVEKLERIWLDRIATNNGRNSNGLFRFRFNPFEYLNPRKWFPNPLTPLTNLARDSQRMIAETAQRFAQVMNGRESFEERALRLVDLSTGVDMSPLEALIRSEIDVARIGLASKQLRIIAANWEAGKPVTFDNRDIEDERGYQAIMAAAAIPGVIPSQIVDNTPFVDGAVLSDTPLLPAIEACDRSGDRQLVLHVIYQDPDLANHRGQQIPNTFSTVYRLYVLAFARSVVADIRAAKRINERLLTVSLNREYAPKPKNAADQDELKRLLDSMSDDVEGKVPLTIHRYRPTEPTTGFLGLLDFNKNRITRLIDNGFEDARDHNCDAAGCVKL